MNSSTQQWRPFRHNEPGGDTGCVRIAIGKRVTRRAKGARDDARGKFIGRHSPADD
jgi:hypothetical protein